MPTRPFETTAIGDWGITVNEKTFQFGVRPLGATSP